MINDDWFDMASIYQVFPLKLHPEPYCLGQLTGVIKVESSGTLFHQWILKTIIKPTQKLEANQSGRCWVKAADVLG